WGHNPVNTWLAQANAIANGRAKGAKLLVIDPRKTPLAAQADCWLQVRPGTDAVLGMGLIREMLKQNKYNHTFVREWTNAPVLVRADTGDFGSATDLIDSINTNNAKSSYNSKGLNSLSAAATGGHQSDTFTDSTWVVWDAHGQQL